MAQNAQYKHMTYNTNNGFLNAQYKQRKNSKEKKKNHLNVP
jgi:hypothetical protein